MKNLISIRDLGLPEISALIARAGELREQCEGDHGVEPALSGGCVANMFFEPSTRTRLSFDLAAQRLGAHVITLDPETSSASKGESLHDTALTLAAIGADILVVRHSQSGMPRSVADWTGLPVVNAGDGVNEHPTQALLDAATLQQQFGSLDGLRMLLVGDIAHSRVAGSLIHLMPALGVELTLVGPRRWLPEGTQLETSTELDRLLPEADVVYLLRVQRERGGEVSDDFVSRYRLDRERSSRLPGHAVVMHAGPLNRGIEISDDVADSPRSLITEQVRSGVPIRMAVLEALGGGGT